MNRRSFITAGVAIAGAACSRTEPSTSLGSGRPPLGSGTPVCSVLSQSQYLHVAEEVVAAGGWGFETLGFSDITNIVRLVDQQLISGAIDITYSSAANPCDAGCLGVLPSVTVTSSGTPVAYLQEGCSFAFLMTNAFCGGTATSPADFVLMLGPFSVPGVVPLEYVLVFPHLEKLIVVSNGSYTVVQGRFGQQTCTAQPFDEPIGTATFSLVWPVITPPIFQNGEIVRFLPLNVLAVGCPNGDCTGFSEVCASPPPCTVFSVCEGTVLQELVYLTAAQNATCAGG